MLATLETLPLPPDKSGWPWTEQTVLDSSAKVDLSYPRISIITPSYNQGHFIEETIRSILLQGYPNLEYIIIDGGSSDNTVETIKKYEPWLTYWVSEPDRGQTHAINKGVERATGEVIAYLNSDDYYLPGTLFQVAEYFRQCPETDLLHGRCRYVNQQGEKIGEQFASITTFEEIIDLWDVWWKKRQFVQPEVFWSKRISDRIGEFNEALYYVMDYEYWCRILQAGGRVGSIDSELTCFRFTETQKSNQSTHVADELLNVVQPWLWSSAAPVAWNKRLVLQGQWLYQAVFLKQIEKSVEAGEHKLVRYFKLIGLIATSPQLLMASGFHHRLQKILLE